MKKINRLFTSLIICSCLFFSGCFNPVFYEVRRDVKPEETTVKSPVNALTHVTIGEDEYIVIASDGGLRYKLAASSTHDEWKTYSKIPMEMHHYSFDSSSHEGEQILGVYASSDFLYLLTATIGVNDDTGTTYPNCVILRGAPTSSITSSNATWSDTAEWTTIISDSGSVYFPIYYSSSAYHSAFSLIQTNAVQKANRKVYIRRGDPNAFYDSVKTVKYYELSGVGEPKEITPEVVAESAEKSFARSAVYFNGKTIFFSSYAATTDETAEKAASHYYYAFNGDIYYGTSTESPVKAITLSGKVVSAMAVCNDALLIGCAAYEATTNSSSNGGIYKTALMEGVPGDSLATFTTNAQFQVTSSYYVTALLNATPEKNELDSYLYCATQTFGTDATTAGNFNNVGLWSYYPSRGNWNRE